MRLGVLVFAVLAACAPRLNSPMLSERSKAVAATDDQATLARVARTDKAWTIRREAVNRLTDQSVLADVARKDKDHRVRRAAVDRIASERVLAEVAREDRERSVRLAAARRIQDPAVLEGLKNAGRSVRVLALGRLGEEDELVKIATRTDAAYGRVDKAAAAGFLTSKERLLLVIESGDNLPQQVAHLGLVVYSPEFQRRFAGASVRCEGDTTFRYYTTGVPGSRLAVRGDAGTLAVEHDGKTLGASRWATRYPRTISVAFGASTVTRLEPVNAGPLIRRLAAKLPAEDLQALRDSPSYQVRVAVISILDPAALDELAGNDPQARIRAAAVVHTTDQALKARVAQSDSSSDVRIAAVRTMIDKETVKRISEDTSQKAAVREAARERLKRIPE